MTQKRYIFLLISLFFGLSAFAQKDVRHQLRKGNTAYKDSLFIDAEVAYRKAIDATPTNEVGISYFNLGNTLMNQSKYEEALQEFARAADVETDKSKKAQALHNMGVLFQADQQYDKAIDVYKEALRNNPTDDETRYNLALAMKQKQEQDQDQEGKDDKEDQQDQNKDEDKQDQDQNQDQNKDQQQNQDQNKDDKKDEQENQSQNNKNSQELSKETVDKMLDAILREEKKTQEKVQKQQVLRGKNKLEKDW